MAVVVSSNYTAAGTNFTYQTADADLISGFRSVGQALEEHTHVDTKGLAVGRVTALDTLFTLQDNSDATKQLQFQLSGITTGTTRTITVPDASGTMYVTGGTDVSLADGGTGASLTDPNADRILFWDDSAGVVTWLAADGTNLVITATTLDIGTGVYRSGGTDVAVADGGTGASSFAAASLPTLTSTDTLTNKRVTQRVETVADAATVTPTADASDMYTVTALAQAATIAAPSGTPTNGQKLIIRLLDNGTARALTWDAIYAVVGTTLPTTTVLSKYTYVGCIYNTASVKWDVVAVQTQA